MEKERKGKGEFNYVFFFICFANSRPNAQLQHIVLYRMSQRRNRMEKNATTAKEKCLLFTRRNNRKFCHSDAAIFFSSFYLFIKGQKKTLFVIKCFFFLRKWNLFATDGMKIYLFHLSLCMRV